MSSQDRARLARVQSIHRGAEGKVYFKQKINAERKLAKGNVF
jgi:hypothetical protein